MSLLTKYTPSSIKESVFNNDILEKLKYICKSESVQHILIQGPHGSGKQVTVKLLLGMLYDEQVYDTSDVVYKIPGSGSKITEVFVKQSNYHIAIEPGNNNFDKYIIQEIVKEYAKKLPLDVYKTKRVFHTVLINNADNLSYYAQTSLRRTMEIYSATCRFIMWCNNPSKIIEPLASRCACLTLKSPSDEVLLPYMLRISYKENINLDLQTCCDILNIASGNIKEVLWQLHLEKCGMRGKSVYHDVISKISSSLIAHDMDQIDVITKKYDNKKNKNTKKPLCIRQLTYDMTITNISANKIALDVMECLCNNKDVPDECKRKIIEIVSEYEHNLVKARHNTIHLEAMYLLIMKLFTDYEELHPEYINIFKKYYIEYID